MTHSIRKQTGFTLVEISIVLVIIGLILGGVLKGQSMVDNAKAKALAGEFKAVWTMLNAYKDIYKATPGDDPLASDHNANALVGTVAASLGNNKIDTGTWTGADTPLTDNESALFWNHVRLAGMATGLAGSGRASNAVGGPLGVTSNANRPTTPAGVNAVYYICSGNIPGKLARAVDIALDDQDATKGNVFAAIEDADGLPITAPKAASAYLDNGFYTLCMAV